MSNLFYVRLGCKFMLPVKICEGWSFAEAFSISLGDRQFGAEAASKGEKVVQNCGEDDQRSHLPKLLLDAETRELDL